MEVREAVACKSEGDEAWTKWNSSVDYYYKVKTYMGGRTLSPRDRAGYTFSKPTKVLLVGRRGAGKTAYFDTLDHIFNKTPFQEFSQAHGAVEGSHTYHRQGKHCVASSKSFTDYVQVYDSEGVLLDPVQIAELSNDIVHADGVFAKMTHWIAGGKFWLQYDAIIVVWRADANPDDISVLDGLLTELNKLTDVSPLVLLTHIDHPDAKKNWSKIQTAFESRHARVVPISNYIYSYPLADHKNQDTEKAALKALYEALKYSDLSRVRLQQRHQVIQANTNACHLF